MAKGIKRGRRPGIIDVAKRYAEQGKAQVTILLEKFFSFLSILIKKWASS
jgi:hypothetical protein